MNQLYQPDKIFSFLPSEYPGLREVIMARRNTTPTSLFCDHHRPCILVQLGVAAMVTRCSWPSRKTELSQERVTPALYPPSGVLAGALASSRGYDGKEIIIYETKAVRRFFFFFFLVRYTFRKKFLNRTVNL